MITQESEVIILLSAGVLDCQDWPGRNRPLDDDKDLSMLL